MPRHYLLFWLFLFNLLAQAQVDTSFIEVFPDKLVISPYLNSRVNTVTIEPRPISGDTFQQSLSYQPNLRGGFGLEISYRMIDFAIGFRQKLTEENERLNGKSNSTNISFRLWATRHLLTEFTFHRIQGFSNRSTPAYDTLNHTRDYPYESREDMQIRYLKIRGVYQLNPHRFSYRSAFSFSERQKKSAGGFLFNASLYSHRMHSDSSLIPRAIREDYGEFGETKDMRILGFGFGPGIGGTWTKGRWFISSVLFLGMDIQYFSYEMPSRSATKKEVRLSNMADFRLSLGYNAPRFFIGIQSWNDYNSLRPSAYHVKSVFGRVNFSFGWRIGAPHLLNRSYDKGVSRIIPERFRKYLY